MSEENGVENGTMSFYRQLPVEQMVCDVSIFNDQQSNIAFCFCIDCGLKMSEEVDQVVHRSSGPRKGHSRAIFKTKVWADEARYPSFKTPTQGMAMFDADGKMKITGSGAAEKLRRSGNTKVNVFAKSYQTLQLSESCCDSDSTLRKVMKHESLKGKHTVLYLFVYLYLYLIILFAHTYSYNIHQILISNATATSPSKHSTRTVQNPRPLNQSQSVMMQSMKKSKSSKNQKIVLIIYKTSLSIVLRPVEIMVITNHQ